MDMLIDALLDWLMQHGGYDVENVPRPQVHELDAAALTREVYRDAPERAPARGVDSRLFAVYSWDAAPEGVIYILDRALVGGELSGGDPLENPLFQERLLHELVHHVQYHTGAYERFPCRARGERDAYLLGGKFLRQRGVTDPLQDRDILALLYSLCRD